MPKTRTTGKKTLKAKTNRPGSTSPVKKRGTSLTAKKAEPEIFGPTHLERIKALTKAATLPRKQLIPILKKAAVHWDRDLRKAALEQLSGISPAEARKAMKAAVKAHGLSQVFIQKIESQISPTPKKRTLPTRCEHAKTEVKSSHSFPNLSGKFGIPANTLGWFVRHWKDADDLYAEFELPKKRGGKRIVAAPTECLKALQGLIYQNVLSKIALHTSCQGFRKNTSILTNAKPHTKSDVVINIDLKDFFPSISAARVYSMLSALLKKELNDSEIRLITRAATRKGALPQGAPTSPVLANIIAKRMDKRLAGMASKSRMRYTRYADDLTFSGKTDSVATLPLIRQIIKEEGFTISAKKFRIIRHGNRQEVTGLTVNEKVTVPRMKRKWLRAALHHVVNGQPVTLNGKVLSPKSLRGHVAFIGSVHPELAAKYMPLLDKHLPKE